MTVSKVQALKNLHHNILVRLASSYLSCHTKKLGTKTTMRNGVYKAFPNRVSQALENLVIHIIIYGFHFMEQTNNIYAFVFSESVNEIYIVKVD